MRILDALRAERPGQAVRVDTNATAASAARFLDNLVSAAPFTVKAVQVDGGSEFMAEFEAARAAKGGALAVLPPKSPKQNGRVERLQATLRNGCYNVQDTAVNVTGIRHLIDENLAFHNGEIRHDSLDGMTPDEFLASRRSKETPPLHMLCAGTTLVLAHESCEHRLGLISARWKSYLHAVKVVPGDG